MTTDLISNPFSGPVSTQKSDCDLSSNADSGSYSNSGLDSCSGSPSCSSNSESDAGLGSDFNLEDIPVILCGLGNSHSDSNPITFPASGSGSKAEYIEPKLQPVAKKRFVREMMPASRESGEVESPKSRCGCLIN